MTRWLWQYLITLGVFLALDFVWLSTVGRTVYQPKLAHLLKPKPNLAVAFAFYALFVAGLMAFAGAPARVADDVALAVFQGGLLGLVAYGCYDLTNLATLRGFPASVAALDMAWGTALAAASAAVGMTAARALGL